MRGLRDFMMTLIITGCAITITFFSCFIVDSLISKTNSSTDSPYRNERVEKVDRYSSCVVRLTKNAELSEEGLNIIKEICGEYLKD